MNEAREWRDWHEAPSNVDPRVWAGAVELGYRRHGQAPYPQPSDLKDAEAVISAADRVGFQTETAHLLASLATIMVFPEKAVEIARKAMARTPPPPRQEPQRAEGERGTE